MDNTIIGLIILGILNLILIAGHFLYVKETNKEKAKLINAIISRSATELRDLELTEKVKPIQTAVISAEPSLIPEAELSDEEFFDKVIGEETGNG